MKVKVQAPYTLVRLTKHRKRCRVCGEIRLLSDFNRAVGNRDGLRNECRICAAQQARDRREHPVSPSADLSQYRIDWGVKAIEQPALPLRAPVTIKLTWDEDGEPHVEVLK